VLTIGTAIYLASLPFGWLSHRNYVRRDAEANGQGQTVEPHGEPAETAGGVSTPSNSPAAVLPFERGGERPTHR
jgi:hypothetical protein